MTFIVFLFCFCCFIFLNVSEINRNIVWLIYSRQTVNYKRCFMSCDCRCQSNELSRPRDERHNGTRRGYEMILRWYQKRRSRHLNRRNTRKDRFRYTWPDYPTIPMVWLFIILHSENDFEFTRLYLVKGRRRKKKKKYAMGY